MDQNIINQEQYKDFVKTECSESEKNDYDESQMRDHLPKDLINSDVIQLKEYIEDDGKGQYITWLQSNLLETCYIKLCFSDPDLINDRYVLEPTIYSHIRKCSLFVIL